MAGIPREHSTLYFDALCRTQKKETVLSLIKATYYAKKNNATVDDVKKEIAERLKHGYGLFKDNIRGYDNGIGSYQGTLEQFSSQYTIGHELSIWKNSDLELNDLAIKVAKDEITITKYFDIVFLNYFQPVQGKNVHPLYSILKYMGENKLSVFEKSMLGLALTVPTDDGSTNALFNMLGDTSYFTFENNKLVFNDNYDIEKLMECCNTKYLGQNGLLDAKRELNDSDSYIKYITYENPKLNDAINLDIDKTYINKFRKYYVDNIERLKRDHDWSTGRKDFLAEYPLDRINILQLDEYALGTDNYENSFSYKLEYGKYKNLGIGIGGGTAAKHGIYRKKDTKKYYGINNKEIDNPQEYWLQFRTELYSYLKSLSGIKDMYNAKDKYPYLQGTSMVLTKLANIYYPEYFLNICSKEKLLVIASYFSIPINKNDSSEKISFEINKFIRRMIPEVNQNHSYYIGDMLYKFTDFIDENNIILDDDKKEKINPYNKEDFLKDVYIDEEDYEKLNNLLNKKKNIILEGAPGVGKTFMAKRLAYSRIGYEDNSKILMIQFHQSYSYEDFIEGIRPVDGNFKVVDGVFKEFCLKAQSDKSNNYYCIIDEINRGNISKILGELMMLIETDKRDKEKLKLPYSGDEFYVPENLYIIGMLNTADRSLALIDYALRRRFSFYKVVPAFNNEKFKQYIEEYLDKRFDRLIEEIKKLNIAIDDDDSLGDGFEIGHSYFCQLNHDYEKELGDIVEYDILPMLREYWFDDKAKYEEWEKALTGVINE